MFETEQSKVAHLLRRAGFGATEAELSAYTSLGFQGALNQLLHPEQVNDSAADAAVAPYALPSMDPTERQARGQIQRAKFVWLVRMLHTQRPLQEKMTLFWHTHFATANSKVANAPLMLNQIQLFRDNALGSFETLLQKVTRDPAMLIWLDNRLNRKNAPNENYAREVMELFTLGIGNYTEDDVHAGARAFTGYTLNKQFQAVFVPRLHDASQKTFMGVTKNWDANDILAALVRHPAHAPFLTTKLFRFFVHDHPTQDTIKQLSNTYVSSGFDLRALMTDMLSGPEFLSADAYHAIVKSPLDSMVGMFKALNVRNVGPDSLQSLARMGQDLLNPPDVSGWKGGSAWVNSTGLFERFNAANRILTSRNPSGPYYTDIAGMVSAHKLATANEVVDYLVNYLVDGDATPQARQALVDFLNAGGTPFTVSAASVDQRVRGATHLALSLPTYHLA